MREGLISAAPVREKDWLVQHQYEKKDWLVQHQY